MAETVNSVKFYSLASMPRKYQNGAFLNLTRGDESNPSGLYFCYNNTWKYLVNLNNDIKSAAVFNGVVYFYNVSPAPSSPDGALFSVKLPTLGGGDGISVSNDEINVDLSTTTVSGNTTTPHTGSANLLKIDSNNKLSLSDTWDCGEYDEQVYRHVKHLKTSNVSYVHVLKADIPDGTVVSSVSSIPSDPTVNSPLYIQLTTGNRWYYKLSGKTPAISSIQYGEIAVSYADGFERLFIKNSNNEIIEFEPANKRPNVVSNATFTNEYLESVNSECVWKISYTDITDAGIGIFGAVVFLRENKTGRQLIPDIVFNDDESVVIITLYSKNNIDPDEYTAIVMGSNYNNII